VTGAPGPRGDGGAAGAAGAAANGSVHSAHVARPASGVGERLGRLHVLVDSLELADAALDGGAPTLQVRLKDGTDADRYRLAAVIAERCRAAGATCLINDRADVAVAAGADGVHVGATDLPVEAASRPSAGSSAPPRSSAGPPPAPPPPPRS
jgi:hypothetical protein